MISCHALRNCLMLFQLDVPTYSNSFSCPVTFQFEKWNEPRKVMKDAARCVGSPVRLKPQVIEGQADAHSTPCQRLSFARTHGCFAHKSKLTTAEIV
jgi:hypothetical protein